MYFVELDSNRIFQEVSDDNFILWKIHDLFAYKIFGEFSTNDEIIEEINESYVNKTGFTIKELLKLHEKLSSDVGSLSDEDVSTQSEYVIETVKTYLEELFPHPKPTKRAIA